MVYFYPVTSGRPAKRNERPDEAMRGKKRKISEHLTLKECYLKSRGRHASREFSRRGDPPHPTEGHK